MLTYRNDGLQDAREKLKENLARLDEELAERGDGQKPYISKLGNKWQLLNSAGKVVKEAFTMQELQGDLDKLFARRGDAGDLQVKKVNDKFNLYNAEGKYISSHPNKETAMKAAEELQKEYKTRNAMEVGIRAAG